MVLVPIKDVMKEVKVKSRSTVYSLVERGIIPPPIKLAPRIVRWDMDRLRQHLSDLDDNE